MRLKGLLTEDIVEDDTPIIENRQEVFPIFDRILDLLESIDPSKFSDKMCDSIGEALGSFIDIIEHLEEVELEGESLVLLEDVIDELNTFDDETEELNEYQYVPKKTGHGTKRSTASLMTGKQKQRYIATLRKRKRIYKSNAALRAKRKKKQYWARKTAQYKRTRKVYVAHKTQRQKAAPTVAFKRLRA